MDKVVAARKLIGDLVKADQIAVRRVEIVGRDLVAHLATLARPPSGQDLGEWLEEHPQVEELSASTAVLDELVERYLRDPANEVVTPARDAALEAQLADDPTAYQVYADWLQERGDPFGELIALGIDGNVERFERHLKRHAAYFLGELADEPRVRLAWRHGFVREIDALGELEPPLWERLLGLRACERLEAITLRRPCSDAVATVIAGAAPASMRAMVFESVAGALPLPLLRRPLTSIAVRATPAAFELVTLPPSLVQLDLQVLRLARVPPELAVRALSIYATEANLTMLSNAALPQLAHLTLYLIGTDDMIGGLARLATPALSQLTLRGDAGLDVPMFQRLAALPIAGRVRSLGLIGGGITDDTIGAFAATRGFAVLEEIDVSDNELTRPGLDAARGLAPKVTSTRQRRRGHAAERAVRLFAGATIGDAEKIADPAAWRRAGIDGDIAWARYRAELDHELFVARDLSRYGCTCESHASPCAHVVALALIAARTSLPAARSNGIETRVASRAGLADLLRASLDATDD